jgi:hypothetical protein
VGNSTKQQEVIGFNKISLRFFFKKKKKNLKLGMSPLIEILKKNSILLRNSWQELT